MIYTHPSLKLSKDQALLPRADLKNFTATISFVSSKTASGKLFTTALMATSTGKAAAGSFVLSMRGASRTLTMGKHSLSFAQNVIKGRKTGVVTVY